jgi:hypothetical protein
MLDYLKLFLLLPYAKNIKNVIFIAPNQVNYERFIETQISEKSLFINYHTTKPIQGLCNSVYNIGVLAGLVNRICNRNKQIYRTVKIYDHIYKLLYRIMRGKKVYIPCFYDCNGFALTFNTHRKSYQLIEVQHGGICNFFPYKKPVEFPLVDKIVVNNERTEKYLQSHLYKNIKTDIEILPSILRENELIDNKRLVILYCSTIETNGIHPNFLSFLRNDEDSDQYRLLIRLHPREKGKEHIFIDQLEGIACEYEFDNSENWLNGNNYNKLIVVSPWSSVIEDAYDNNVISIVIDEFGYNRFKDIIDEKKCFYTNDILPVVKNYLD